MSCRVNMFLSDVPADIQAGAYLTMIPPPNESPLGSRAELEYLKREARVLLQGISDRSALLDQLQDRLGSYNSQHYYGAY